MNSPECGLPPADRRVAKNRQTPAAAGWRSGPTSTRIDGGERGPNGERQELKNRNKSLAPPHRPFPNGIRS